VVTGRCGWLLRGLLQEVDRRNLLGTQGWFGDESINVCLKISRAA
jgi:hypothetical protein